MLWKKWLDNCSDQECATFSVTVGTADSCGGGAKLDGAYIRGSFVSFFWLCATGKKRIFTRLNHTVRGAKMCLITIINWPATLTQDSRTSIMNLVVYICIRICLYDSIFLFCLFWVCCFVLFPVHVTVILSVKKYIVWRWILKSHC
jgi:hypothetical protein